ncbi:MAG: GTP pyrophosphokinase [Bacteroidetes bacterium]|nr:GTP pyrophosphokinase [Bacteroidota bacterium]
MPTLADAIILAVNAHRYQVDKAGQPYYLHTLRVMTKARTETEQVVAVLHDLIEDTAYTPDDLRSIGCSDEILGGLDCLTHRKGESYDQFIERIKPNPIARRVKLADLEDNMDLTRLTELRDEDLHRYQRYVKAWHVLSDPEADQ